METFSRIAIGDLQAQDRAHRLGQKFEVKVFKLITISAVEEHMQTKALQKLDDSNKIIQVEF